MADFYEMQRVALHNKMNPPVVQAKVIPLPPTPPRAQTIYLVVAYDRSYERWSLRHIQAAHEFSTLDSAIKHRANLSSSWSDAVIFQLDCPGVDADGNYTPIPVGLPVSEVRPVPAWGVLPEVSGCDDSE